MTLLHGDCLALMPTLDAESVDAIVCDPPAGISFMGKSWDADKGGRDQWIAWLALVMREGLRLLKPGGHALVWALPRTSHWTGMALEDAGFEVRDRITHLFGSGFPKSLDVSKAMDKAAGAERGVIGLSPHSAHRSARTFANGNANLSGYNEGDEGERVVTAPATDLARQWEGWGTALKPAAEDWWLARKPLIGTVAANVAAHGTGAINVDGCRIGTDEVGKPRETVRREDRENWRITGGSTGSGAVSPVGRWPANVVLSHSPECREVGTRRVKGSNLGVYRRDKSDSERAATSYAPGAQEAGYSVNPYADADGLETVTAWECAPDCAVRLLDQQSGERTSGAKKPGGIRSQVGCDFRHGERTGEFAASSGGASRFFYTSKASRAERSAGLGDLPASHPTVKPLSLMRWLCRLVTPPGGLILDPFMGSGTTGCAAVLEGFRFLGIESSEEYCDIARRRIAYHADTVQPTLEFTA